jgi:hypothetical protein
MFLESVLILMGRRNFREREREKKGVGEKRR